MKKIITYIRRFIIVFTIVAYVFPILCFPAFSIYHFLNTKQTVAAKDNNQKNSIPLLNEDNREILNKDNIENFADHTFNEQLKKFNVPGAVFTVVKDNNVIFEKGYGYSDLDKKTPVDPKKTMFRLASISKLFTATAVMQLKEKGKISLKEDVNKYLRDFKIENKYSKPVTLENLLTHTAGFDEKFVGESQTRSYLQEKSLKDNLISHSRPLIREPGIVPQYSNYGMAVAGYAVESVSGVSFANYMENNLLKPLHMNNTSFIFDKKTLANLSQGYDYKNGIYKKVPLYGQTFLPSAGLKSTADDMAKFMIAHLNNGTYENSTILNKDSISDMHKNHFPTDINLPCMCYGFSENYINGVKVLMHGGNEYGFYSMLYLIPDSNLGFFISTNGDKGGAVCNTAAQQFMNRYYPQSRTQATANTEVEFAKSNLKKLEGTYMLNRHSKKDIGKLMMLLYPCAKIKSTKDALIVKFSNIESTYKEIEPSIFKNMKKGDTFTFKSDKPGNVYIINSGSATAYEKIQWYENPAMHKIIFALFSILFLFMSIIMILLKFKKKMAEEPKYFKHYRYIIFSTSILNLLFLLGMTKSMLSLSPFLPELPNMIKYLLVIPIITTILSFGLLISTCVHWNKEKSNFSTNICTIVISCIFLIFSLYLNYWNLLGFKF
jgi:CubicO group peptidase (beta-lactamase class C family)